MIHRELKLLQETPTFIGSERERQEYKKKRRQIANAVLEASTAAAQSWVVQGNFNLAVAGALNFGRLFASQNKYDQALRACAMDAEVFKKSGTANSHSACSAIYVNICEIIMNWFEQAASTFVHDAANSLANAVAEESQSRQQMYTDLEIREAVENMRHVVNYSSEEPLKETKVHCELKHSPVSALLSVVCAARRNAKRLTLPKAETAVVAEAQQADALEDNWSSRQEANDEEAKRHDDEAVSKELKKDAKEQARQISGEAGLMFL
ncbi:hypothetical protein, conserved [Eimeria necatrix]|uniref:Uncharacterized protein n=1 Tax=Eimeria necatrix TaxID=51315 RepID=U6MMC9_9EIME|nr:hypothetical protein, conserved [Eimeria necatrix]CDJ64228.1 hypothetical protein, conserved [Eimeria necatrix]